MQTDASLIGVGAVLLQEQDDGKYLFLVGVGCLILHKGIIQRNGESC